MKKSKVNNGEKMIADEMVLARMSANASRLKFVHLSAGCLIKDIVWDTTIHVCLKHEKRNQIYKDLTVLIF